MRHFIKRVFDKITLRHHHDKLLQEQEGLRQQIQQLQDQLFMANPVLILEGVKFYLPLFYTDHIQKIIYRNREFYEKETLRFLQLHYRHFNAVIDIGSNIGNHMLFYCTQMQAKKVYCFEPHKFNLNILQQNIALNYLEDRVDVYPVALGAGEGKGVQAGFSCLNTGMNSVQAVGAGANKEQEVDIQSLDSYQIAKADFIKIDVEGFEIEVLKGAVETIKRCKPVILVEVFESNRQKVDALMESYGYQKFFTLKQFDTLYIPA